MRIAEAKRKVRSWIEEQRSRSPKPNAARCGKLDLRQANLTGAADHVGTVATFGAYKPVGHTVGNPRPCCGLADEMMHVETLLA